jgi:phage anti-repressor protein
MKNRKRLACSLVNCEECCTVILRTKSNTWGCKQPFSKWNSSFQSWFVCQNQVDYLRISFCYFTKKDSMKNQKQLTRSLVTCKEYCTVNLRTKSNTWGCKQPFSKWNSSFQSWFVCQNHVDHLRILFFNFTKNSSMKNLKRPTRSLVNCEESFTGNHRTKLNSWGYKQPFSKWISSFQSWSGW